MGIRVADNSPSKTGHGQHECAVQQRTPSLLDNAVAQILKTKLTFLSQLAVREKSHFTSGFFSLLSGEVVLEWCPVKEALRKRMPVMRSAVKR